jgi:acyl carrier protein
MALSEIIRSVTRLGADSLGTLSSAAALEDELVAAELDVADELDVSNPDVEELG